MLPLYPQYCSSTTGSVFDRTSRALQRWRWLPETRFINDYHDDAGYIDALAARIERALGRARRAHASAVLLSRHSRELRQGGGSVPGAGRGDDPRGGVAAADWPRRTGRIAINRASAGCVWLQPYTEDTLQALAKRGMRKLTVVSPSFAVDCLETLQEVAIEYRDKFLELGGERLTLVPPLNDDDRHVECWSPSRSGSFGLDINDLQINALTILIYNNI